MSWSAVAYTWELFIQSLETEILWLQGHRPLSELLEMSTGAGSEEETKSGVLEWDGNLTQQSQGRGQANPLLWLEEGVFWCWENFIGGKFLPCSSYLDSYDPSTGEVYCRVPNSGEEGDTFSWRRLQST